MINNPGTNLNAVPEEAAMNNSFPQANDNRRMNDKGADSLDINKGSMPVQANSDQMQTGGYYQPNQQIQQDGHAVPSNVYNPSSNMSVSAPQYSMQYNSHGQQGHSNMVSGHAYSHMQPIHSHQMNGNDSYMHLQQNSALSQQYIPHSNPNQANGNPAMVGGAAMSSSIQHVPHHSQVVHSQGYNQHIPNQMQMQNQADSSHLGSHLQGQGQQMPQSGQFSSLMHRGIPPYINQPVHGLPNGQNHNNTHVNMPIPSSVQSQPSTYSMPGQGPPMYPGSQMVMNTTMPQAMQNLQANNNSTLNPAGITSRAQQPKAWHSAEHQQERLSISEDIVRLLKSRRPNAAENWTDKLPQMAKKLEDALYHEAENFEEYRDRQSLKNRLQRLAIQMGNGRQAAPGRAPPPNQPATAVPPSTATINRLPGSQPTGTILNNQPPTSNNLNGGPVAAGGQPMNMPHAGQFPPNQQFQAQNQMVGGAPSNYMQAGANYQGQNRIPSGGHAQSTYSHIANPLMHNQNQQMAMPQSQQSYVDYGRSMNMQNQQMNGVVPNQYAMNPELNAQGNYGNNMTNVPHGMMVAPQQIPNGGTFPPMDNNASGLMQNGNNNQYMYHVAPNTTQPGGPTMMQPMNAVANKPAGVGVNLARGAVVNPMQGQQPPSLMVANPGAPPVNADEHRKQVLKQQQQRLLLLRHASKCPHENNRCPVTPHCWGMKQLWKHIMSCKDQDCKVPHCVSSRYVLSHYSKCKEPQCPVCGPVRDAIKKNYERSKEVVGIVTNPTANRNVPPQAAPPIDTKANHPAPQLEEPVKKKRKTNESQAVKNTTLVIRPPQPPPPPAPKKVYPLDPISSAIYMFDVCQIESHIKSIQEGLRVKVSKIKEICKPLIDELYKVQYVQEIFSSPVDYIAFGIPDYPDKVKCPMDLGTVTKKLDSGSYRDFEQMAADVRLTFDNAMLYNAAGSEIHRIAKNAKKDFNDKYSKKISDFERKIAEDRQNSDACTICGEIKLEFAPPVLYCSGSCARAIKRGSWYYSNTANTYYWCPPCFNSIKANEPVHLPDCTISKSELERNRKQHNEVHPESWVECDGGCGRWVHQICSLFNSRRNVQDLPFVCPLCVKEKKVAEPNNANIVMPVTKPMKAVDLPRTVLSDFLEKRIQKRLELVYEETAMNSNTTVDKVEKCPPLTLRQVSCVDKEQDVREGFLSRYKDKNYPTSFPCRVKCLVLFQNIDGQDVILFGMYVYEYGHNCPQPNQRRVYVSYLDSVHYLRPKQYRTLVYHEILISYLDYVKARGFHTAHIWACPPQKGDDYILHIHPVDQKTPRPQTLKIWYEQMLNRCVERGIVVEMQDIHTEYLTEANNDATLLPYFEGDYWVNEAEVIIKNLTEGKKGANSSIIDDNAGQAKRKSKAKRADGKDVVGNPVTRVERDPLLAKLSAIIEPMKDTFFVARLHPKEYADKFNLQNQAPVVVSEEAANDNDAKMQADALTREDVDMPTINDEKKQEGAAAAGQSDSTATAAAAAASDESNGEEQANAATNSEGTMDVDAPTDEEKNEKELLDAANIDESVIESKEDMADPAVVKVAEASAEDTAATAAAAETPAAAAAAEDAATDADPPATTAAAPVAPKKMIMCGEEMPVLTDDTEDVDEPQQNEHFETRQSFLNLCQGNHYQFDQLRRAKHSSMMVLYHLHNPDAPKFVPSCSSCKENILQQAYHCRSCEIDFCHSCVSQQGPRIHNHPLQQVGSAPQIVTEEQRKERERSIKLHMQLLTHAANCPACESKNCARMKEFLNHESVCDKKVAGGCRICSRMSNLLHLHARQCKVDNCKVPHCVTLREQFRKLQMSQMQMDDRRRQQMNLEYNRGTQKGRDEEDD